MFLAGAMLISSTVLSRYENLARDPTFTAMPGVDMCRAMIVREDVDPGSCACRYEHTTHGIE
jgi:hypothetical protein